MSAGKMVLGAMIAVAAGAVLGMLFAPEKGSTARKKLLKHGSRYIDAAKNTAGEYVDTIENTLESARDKAADLTDKVKDAVDTLAGREESNQSHVIAASSPSRRPVKAATVTSSRNSRS